MRAAQLAGLMGVFLIVVPSAAAGDSPGGGPGAAGGQDGLIEAMMTGQTNRKTSQPDKRKGKDNPELTAMSMLPGRHSPMGSVDSGSVGINDKGEELINKDEKPKDTGRLQRSTHLLQMKRRRRGADDAAERMAARGKESNGQMVNLRRKREVTGGGQPPRRRARPPQPNCTGCYSSLNLQSDPSGSSDPEGAE